MLILLKIEKLVNYKLRAKLQQQIYSFLLEITFQQLIPKS